MQVDTHSTVIPAEAGMTRFGLIRQRGLDPGLELRPGDRVFCQLAIDDERRRSRNLEVLQPRLLHRRDPVDGRVVGQARACLGRRNAAHADELVDAHDLGGANECLRAGQRLGGLQLRINEYR